MKRERSTPANDGRKAFYHGFAVGYLSRFALAFLVNMIAAKRYRAVKAEVWRKASEIFNPPHEKEQDNG